MAGIILPNRFKSQPQYAAPTDYAGLGKGVRILFNPAAGPIDLATGRVWAPGGDAAITVAPNGKVFSFDGVSDYYSHTGYPELIGNVGTFFMWCPRVGAADTNGHVFFGASSPVVAGHQVYPTRVVAIGSNSGSTGTLASWFNTTNRSLILASGGTAATCKAFLDGKDSGLTWSDAPKAWGSGNKNFNLGRYVGGSSWDFDGSILVAGHTDAVWGTAEAKAFHENPWQLFKAPARRLWAVTSGTTINPAGAPSTQANTHSAVAITLDYALVGAASTQANASSTGAITLDAVDLIGAASTQGSTGSIDAITQTQVLAASSPTQNGTSSAVAITQVHVLSGAAATQGNLGGAGATSIISEFIGMPSAQANLSGVGQITRPQMLTAVNSTQANLSGTGVISDGIVVEPALTTGIAATIRIKKPGIPSGTPEWLKTLLEILIGRRGNRIEVPKFRILTFSATPTKTECEALYSYTNTVRNALEQLINRMDG